MTVSPQQHLFSRRPSNQRQIERILTTTLKVATYLIILSAGYIFLDIAFHGSKAVFKRTAPFINFEFLTQKPQTLHVYEPKEIHDEMARLNSERIQLQKTQNDLGYNQKTQRRRLKNVLSPSIPATKRWINNANPNA